VKEIFVLAEHRKGMIRDITWEMLGKGRELASQAGAGLTAVLLGHKARGFAEELAPMASRVLVVEGELLENFNAEIYQRVLSALISESKPFLTLIGHTGFGMDLAPSLAAEVGLPLATDCIDLCFQEGRLTAIRQMYGGKVNAEVSFPPDQGWMATVRPGSFPIEEYEPLGGEIELVDSVSSEEITYRRFMEYVEAAAEGADITQADVIVAVGQGIRESKNIRLVEELAEALGGTLACSRPIVDKKWLPKYRQVGTSGKTVSPKVYVAIGISGAFQHVTGMKGAGTIIAINKDPRAPIFRVADYGIVEDLFKVVPLLSEKAKESRAR
jgi:electron transfer flavoprotein alpha subunit